MAEYLAPGVYVEEVERGAKTVEGVGTSTAGFLGPTVRGPSDARVLTSYADYDRLYGGVLDGSHLAAAVEGFFANGGSRCVVGRITATASTAAGTLPAENTNDNGHNNENDSQNNDSQNDNGSEDDGQTNNGSEDDGPEDNDPVADGGGGAITASAIGPGAWGNQVALVVEDASMQASDERLFKLTVRYWDDPDEVEAAHAGAANPENDDVPPPDVEEVYDDLSPVATSSNYYVKQVNDSSVLVELERDGRARPTNTEDEPLWLDGADDDGELDVDHYLGDEPEGLDEPTGFAAFEQIDEIAVICVPDEHATDTLTDAVIQHCRDTGDRFAILQAEQSPGQTTDIRPPADTDMAAFYYPWVEVRNPETGLTEEIPPGGHIAGIYARNDVTHGVHKAPANELVHGIQGLQRTVTRGDQEFLNPRGVNCIRGFHGRGIRVWGARTASSDPEWKYVNVRRLFLFLEESIEEGTQWVVFEPNDERLWARVRQTVSNFLTDVWHDGALRGTTPEEAFYVKCDRTTMTQNDIDNGRLICEIGVAPVTPAEFVVFRISQWTEGAE